MAQISENPECLMLCLQTEELIADGEFENAIEASRRAVEVDPECGYAQCMLAKSHYMLDELDDAIAHYKIAARLDSKDSEAYQGMAVCLFAKGNLEGAAIPAQIAVDIRPESGLAHHTLACYYYSMNEPEKAKDHHEWVRKLNPEAAAQLDEMASSGAEHQRVDPKAEVAHLFDREIKPELIRIREAISSDTLHDRELPNLLGDIMSIESRLQEILVGPDWEGLWSIFFDLKGDLIHTIGQRDVYGNPSIGPTMRKVLLMGTQAYEKSLKIKVQPRTFDKLANLYVFLGRPDDAVRTLGEYLHYLDGSDRVRVSDRIDRIEEGIARYQSDYDIGGFEYREIVGEPEPSGRQIETTPPPSPPAPAGGKTVVVQPRAANSGVARPAANQPSKSAFFVLGAVAVLALAFVLVRSKPGFVSTSARIGGMNATPIADSPFLWRLPNGWQSGKETVAHNERITARKDGAVCFLEMNHAVPGGQLMSYPRAANSAFSKNRRVPYSLISLVDSSINGWPAVTWEFNRLTNGVMLHRKITYFNLKGRGYALGTSVPTGKSPELSRECEAVYASLALR